MRTPPLATGLALAGLLVTAFLAWHFVTLDGRPGEVPGDTVVVIDGARFSQADLEAFVADASRLRSRSAAREAIEAFAAHVLLRREAERRGLGDASDGRVLDLLIGERSAPDPIPEARIEAFYRAHLDRFVAPRRVQFAYVRVARADDVARPRDEIRAIAMRAQMGRGRTSLASLVGADGGSVHAGQSGVVACDEASHPTLPRVVIERVCGMKIGSISDPIETADAYWVARKLSDQPARHLQLSQVRFDIREELTSAGKRTSRERTLRWLLDSGRVQIPPDAPAQLAARTTPKAGPAPTRPPAAPGAGTG